MNELEQREELKKYFNISATIKNIWRNLTLPCIGFILV